MRLRDDSGLSLAELLVVCMLMGVVLAAVYMGLQFSYRAQGVAEQQAAFAREISAPMRTMDKSFSQSTVPAYGSAAEPYHVRLKMPVDYLPGKTIEYDYEATTDGRIVQTVYRVSGTTRTVVRQATWSESNVNRAEAVPMFTYYKGSSVTTDMVGADSVKIEIRARHDGKTYHDTVSVAFRNR